jgi:hypothetical protein
MKQILSVLTFLASAQLTYTYEYRLQFQPGGYMLAVAGYSFNVDTVQGVCSYYTISFPRGGRTNHYNTCRWDQYGNLLTTTPVSSEPQAPPVLSTNGTEIISRSTAQ